MSPQGLLLPRLKLPGPTLKGNAFCVGNGIFGVFKRIQKGSVRFSRSGPRCTGDRRKELNAFSPRKIVHWAEIQHVLHGFPMKLIMIKITVLQSKRDEKSASALAFTLAQRLASSHDGTSGFFGGGTWESQSLCHPSCAFSCVRVHISYTDF